MWKVAIYWLSVFFFSEYSATRIPKECVRKQSITLLKSMLICEIWSLFGSFRASLLLTRQENVVLALCSSGPTSFRDTHYGSCWCFCHEQKVNKVNGAHSDDKAGTAKCVFTAIAPGCSAEMTKCKEERWMPLLQPLRAILARKLICWMTLLLLPPPSSPSPPTLHPSASTLHLGLGTMTGPSIISLIDRCWLQLLWII